MKVAFIGLGIMGSRMAANLIKKDVDLTVFNRSKGAMKTLIDLGAKSAISVTDAVSDADVVFSMLSKPEVVEQVMFGEVLEAMKTDAIWVDSSTVNPSFSLKALEEASRAKVRFLDGPVAGSKHQAQNRELVFLVGGSKNDLRKVESLMNYMGNKVLHIGEVGKGASFKMLVNMLLAQSMTIFSEALLFGQSMGIDKEFLLNVIPNLPVIAPFTKAKADNIRNEDWKEQFPLELLHKDLHLAALTGYEENQPLPMTNLTKELYGQAKKEGMGRLDMSAIYKFLDKGTSKNPIRSQRIKGMTNQGGCSSA